MQKQIINYIKYAVILIAVFEISSCRKDWLNNRNSISLTVPSTLDDFQAMMDNTDRAMNSNSPSLEEVGSDLHYSMDALFQNTDGVSKNAYSWSYNYPYTSTGWDFSSTRIFYCNLTLEGLSKIKANTDEEKVRLNDIKGQALFHRARTIFEMDQIWAPPFDSATAITELGLPYRLESDVNIPSNRPSVKENYDQILSDLLTAKDLVPQVSKYKTRPSKAAVFGLLSRVFLNIRDYKRAGDYADSCLRINNSLMDFNTLDASLQYPIPFGNVEVIFQNYRQSNPPISLTNMFIDSSLYSSYDSNDLRKKIFFTVNPNSTINFRGTYNGSFKPTLPFGGLATDEMFLTRAECYARGGNTTNALNDLNTLLKSRWKASSTFFPLTAPSADSALVLILNERKRELLIRGLRWIDLRRLNKEDRFKTTLSRKMLGVTYTLEPNSYKYTFPIPNDIMQYSNLRQNTGW